LLEFPLSALALLTSKKILRCAQDDRVLYQRSRLLLAPFVYNFRHFLMTAQVFIDG
jgi:hypothetical protein